MHCHRRRALAAALALMGSAGVADVAHAEGSPWSLAVQETVSHDSNVFRAPADTADRPTDWISTTSLIASLDQPFGRERLRLNGEFDLNRFRYQHQLNSSAHSAAAEFDWATVGHLSGEVGYSNSRQLYRYALDNGDFQAQTLAANIQSIGQGFARVHLGVVTDWTLDGSANVYERSFSATTFAPNDLHRKDAGLGVTWRDTPDLTLSLSGKRSTGEYVNIGPNGDKFDRNDLKFGVIWSPTGASTLNASFGTARTDHSDSSQRSSRLWTANVGWNWQPTGRTHVSLAFVRDNDTGSSESTFIIFPVVATDARVRTGWNLASSYSLTGKINVNASLGYTTRLLDSSMVIGGGSPSDSRGSDRLYQASLGVEWRPERSIDLRCGGSRERRVKLGAPSDSLTYSYGAVVLSCTGQFAFN